MTKGSCWIEYNTHTHSPFPLPCLLLLHPLVSLEHQALPWSGKFRGFTGNGYITSGDELATSCCCKPCDTWKQNKGNYMKAQIMQQENRKKRKEAGVRTYPHTCMHTDTDTQKRKEKKAGQSCHGLKPYVGSFRKKKK